MRMQQVENLPLNHLEAGTVPREEERSSWKQTVIMIMALLGLLLSSTSLLYCFFQLKPPETCWAKATLENSQEELLWNWQTIPNHMNYCIKSSQDKKKLEILQEGLYLISGQVASNSEYTIGKHFSVQLRNQEIVLKHPKESNMSDPKLYLDCLHHLHKGDTIFLEFNNPKYINKEPNNTFWQILFMGS
ncbi:tumor necrosis factor ligand superfamily member 18 [Ornithorhynchus anatinus]|uniref:tumor necrosis factor ligand superfamily member 18 n=1 Tax=Ornithorhynchus anatinus TaxID=9258 RepID=UPI000224049A|nr:tumor necrosis factor ligand superfamily member 18 [Ornithorhynchus anatinus]